MISETKRILYLNKVAEIGGAEVSLQSLVNSLKGTDYQPVVVLGQKGPLLQILEGMDIKSYVYPLDWCHFENPFPFIRTIRFLRHLVKQEKIKLIHSNTLWDNQYGVISAKVTKIPHILHVRGFSKSQYTWKSFYHLDSMAICNSQNTCNKFVNASGFRRRVEVVYNGVDTNIFKPVPKKRSYMREYYGFRDTDFVMGMAGRLTEEKGQLQLLKSILPTLRKDQNYKVIICGDTKIHPGTDYCEKIKGFMRSNKLGKQVLLTGFVDDMPSFYNAIDLFLLPSFREPFGRVLIEAMATKIPVIASSVDGVPEVVEHRKTGYLVSPNSVDNWCHYISKLASKESLRKDLGEAGQQRVLEKFTLEHTTSKIVSIYNGLIIH